MYTPQKEVLHDCCQMWMIISSGMFYHPDDRSSWVLAPVQRCKKRKSLLDLFGGKSRSNVRTSSVEKVFVMSLVTVLVFIAILLTHVNKKAGTNILALGA